MMLAICLFFTIQPSSIVSGVKIDSDILSHHLDISRNGNLILVYGTPGDAYPWIKMKIFNRSGQEVNDIDIRGLSPIEEPFIANFSPLPDGRIIVFTLNRSQDKRALILNESGEFLGLVYTADVADSKNYDVYFRQVAWARGTDQIYANEWKRSSYVINGEQVQNDHRLLTEIDLFEDSQGEFLVRYIGLSFAEESYVPQGKSLQASQWPLVHLVGDPIHEELLVYPESEHFVRHYAQSDAFGKEKTNRIFPIETNFAKPYPFEGGNGRLVKAKFDALVNAGKVDLTGKETKSERRNLMLRFYAYSFMRPVGVYPSPTGSFIFLITMSRNAQHPWYNDDVEESLESPFQLNIDSYNRWGQKTADIQSRHLLGEWLFGVYDGVLYTLVQNSDSFDILARDLQ